MIEKRRTLVVGQSGGATAVTNATLAGVVRAACRSGRYDRLLGARYGTTGILREEFVDLCQFEPESLQTLARTPSAALGTSRVRLDTADLDLVLDSLRKADTGALILIGGNDSADTALRVGHAARARGWSLPVVLAPKTVDNDLPMTDHSPGYGSAARCFASIVRDSTWDSLAAPDLYPVKFIDVMGRNAGWLAAAASLAFAAEGGLDQPIVLLPERPPVDADSIIDLVGARVGERGMAICIVPETLKVADGTPLSNGEAEHIDPFGHPYRMPPAVLLAKRCRDRLGLNARFERPGSFVRMAGGSETDRTEAVLVGEAAVIAANVDESGVMVTLEREPGPEYHCSTGLTALESVANTERMLDDAFIKDDGMGLTRAFFDYALPLIGSEPFPPYWSL
ncbi:6-phosphofructokinase [soil metagenome]